MLAYCIFCETMQCNRIAQKFQSLYGLQCIYPKLIQRKWIQGEMTSSVVDYLPGYIFLYSEKKLESHPYFDGMIRWLGNGELSGKDEQFAMMIQKMDGIVGIICLAWKGDKLVVKDPNWEGIDTEVVKVDNGRKRCCVEFSFDQSTKKVWLGFQIVDS